MRNMLHKVRILATPETVVKRKPSPEILATSKLLPPVTKIQRLSRSSFLKVKLVSPALTTLIISMYARGMTTHEIQGHLE
jgi:hypothetical protein